MFIETQIELESLVNPDLIRKVAFTFRISDVYAIREVMDAETSEVDLHKAAVYLQGDSDPFVVFTPYRRLRNTIRTLTLINHNDKDNNIQDDTTITPKGSQ